MIFNWLCNQNMRSAHGCKAHISMTRAWIGQSRITLLTLCWVRTYFLSNSRPRRPWSHLKVEQQRLGDEKLVGVDSIKPSAKSSPRFGLFSLSVKKSGSFIMISRCFIIPSSACVKRTTKKGNATPQHSQCLMLGHSSDSGLKSFDLCLVCVFYSCSHLHSLFDTPCMAWRNNISELIVKSFTSSDFLSFCLEIYNVRKAFDSRFFGIALNRFWSVII